MKRPRSAANPYGVRRTALAIKGDPRFGQRREAKLKGKGSYRRQRRNEWDASVAFA